MSEKKENTNKPCPRWLSWPWNVIIYVALFLVLRIFAIPFIVLLIYLRGKYSPHGGAEGYCLSRTRRRLVWLIPGVILLALGVVGEYIGKIYMETKDRPRFLIAQVLEDRDEEEAP